MAHEAARDRTANPFKEEFARFLEAPTREALRDLLRHQLGELDEFDFKREWPSQRSKIARHVLAIANSGGGAIVFGVEQLADGSFSPIGLGSVPDKKDALATIDRFLPSDLALSLSLFDFAYKESEYGALNGKTFQVLVIPDDPQHLPFVAEADGEDVSRTAVYVRRNTASEPASHDELQHVINRRIETGHSSTHEIELQRQIDDLKLLYAQIAKFDQHTTIEKMVMSWFPRNEDYPSETFDAFIARMIKVKKAVIDAMLKERTTSGGKRS